MSLGRWLAGLVPLVVLVASAAPYAYVLWRGRREAPRADGARRFVLVLVASRVAVGVALALAVWWTRWWLLAALAALAAAELERVRLRRRRRT